MTVVDDCAASTPDNTFASDEGVSTTSANWRRLYNIADVVVLVLVAGWILRDLRTDWLTKRPVDDAYMFARYAANVRHGFGMSWNSDGIHTYGQTSLAWCAVVALLSYFKIGAGKMLILASGLSSIGALIALAWAVAVNGKSRLLSSTWRVLPWIALPLVETPTFKDLSANGMETMLAGLLCALFVGLTLKWQRGAGRPTTVGLVGVLLFLTRPESALVVVLFPLLVFFLMRGIRRGSLARLLGVFFAGVALDLAACKLYFHTAVPLPFYLKGLHGYQGYAAGVDWHPELYLLVFLATCELYLLALIFLSRKEDWRLLACCLTTGIVMFAYLQTVLQIGGGSARYYVSYLAFLVVPALLVADRWLASGSGVGEDSEKIHGDTALERFWPGNTLLVRWCVAGIVMLGCIALTGEGTQRRILHAEKESHYEYDPVEFEVVATTPLPRIRGDKMIQQLTDVLVAPLPRGTTVAASEVGYLGASATQVNVIDLVGLNDTQIARHGLDPGEVLARKPDIIWMPHDAYTYERGLIMSNPELLRQYDVYAGAANYGLALRKDSPYRAQIDRQMQVFWNDAYPGFRMSDYLVKTASWTRQKHRVLDDE